MSHGDKLPHHVRCSDYRSPCCAYCETAGNALHCSVPYCTGGCCRGGDGEYACFFSEQWRWNVLSLSATKPFPPGIRLSLNVLVNVHTSRCLGSASRVMCHVVLICFVLPRKDAVPEFIPPWRSPLCLVYLSMLETLGIFHIVHVVTLAHRLGNTSRTIVSM